MKTSNRTRPLPQEVNFSAPTRLSVEDYRALNASSAKPILKPKAKRVTVRRHMLGTEIQRECIRQFRNERGVPGAVFHANASLDVGGASIPLIMKLKADGVDGGVPDTWGRGIDRPSGIFVEFKGRHDQLTPAQKQCFPILEALGERIAIIRSLDEGLALLEAENILRGRAS